MSPQRYKILLTYLPGMASVVNAFDSAQVQNSVYEVLMEALDCKLQNEGLGQNSMDDRPALVHAPPLSNGSLAHDLVEGESIHADQPRKLSKSASSVF